MINLIVQISVRNNSNCRYSIITCLIRSSIGSKETKIGKYHKNPIQTFHVTRAEHLNSTSTHFSK